MKTGWIEIASEGWQTDMRGVPHYFSPARFRWIASQYRPEWHEAPAVVGHPETDDPAYGWVSALREKNGTLEAKFAQMPKKFFRWAIEKGRMKKRSMSLFPDGRLRHVGFLGATPPAMRGLKNIAFSVDDVHFTFFQEDSSMSKGKPKKAYRREIAALQAQIQSMQGGPDFSAHTQQITTLSEDLAEERSRRKKAEKELKEATAALSDSESQSISFSALSDDEKTSIEERTDKLIKDGKIMSSARGYVIAFASGLAAGPDQTFSIDGGKKRSAIDHFWSHLDALDERSIFFQYSDDYSSGQNSSTEANTNDEARAAQIAGRVPKNND